MISVILAGGKGVRLWPESTDKKPKQVCDFMGQGSLLSMTVERLQILGDVKVICGDEQLDIIRKELNDSQVQVLTEPIGRNTAPAVGLVLAQNDYPEDEVIAIFPADHYIANNNDFLKVLRESEQIAKKGYLLTIGIKASYPETGYGYIEKDIKSDYLVKAFHEKPDKDTAEQYIKSGNYYWNAGIFLATVAAWKELFKEHLPELYKYILEGKDSYLEAYPDFSNISIDYGIAEKCSRMAVVEGDFGWSDVGSWDALANILEHDENGNSIHGDALAVDSTACLLRSSDKKIVAFGLENMVVVETEDTILVCPRDRSQDVKELHDIVMKTK